MCSLPRVSLSGIEPKVRFWAGPDQKSSASSRAAGPSIIDGQMLLYVAMKPPMVDGD